MGTAFYLSYLSMKEIEGKISYPYLTEFKATPQSKDIGVTIPLAQYACFSANGIASGFRRYKGKQTFEVTIYKKTDESDSKKNHLCLFRRDQIESHIRELESVLDKSEFGLLSIDEEETLFKVSFFINSEKTLIFSYALTWIRYLWEMPFSLALHDAFELKTYYPDLSIRECFTITRKGYPNRFSWATNHSSAKSLKRFYTEEWIKDKLHLSTDNLNEFFEKLKEDDKPGLLLPETIDKFKSESDIEYWTSKDTWDIRLKTYKKIKSFYDSL